MRRGRRQLTGVGNQDVDFRHLFLDRLGRLLRVLLRRHIELDDDNLALLLLRELVQAVGFRGIAGASKDENIVARGELLDERKADTAVCAGDCRSIAAPVSWS